MCRLGWGLSLELLWGEQEALQCGSGWRCNFPLFLPFDLHPLVTSALPLSQTHVCWPSRLTVLYEQMRRLWVLRKGRPTVWLSQYFLLILNKLFYLFVFSN